MIGMAWKSKRRSIKGDTYGWIGLDSLLKYYERCPTEYHRKIFNILFETGSRASEAIVLQPQHVKWNDVAIRVQGLPLLKKKKRMVRNFLWKIEGDPFAEDFIDFVQSCNTRYLIPAHQKFSGLVLVDQHPTRSTILVKMYEVSPDLWCHWFRSMRARFFVNELKMDAFQLADWFSWTNMDMPLHYVSETLEKMAENMGIPKNKIPS